MSRTRTEFTHLLFEWLNQVESDAELPASAFKIAWRLAQHFDKDTLECFPGIRHIADKTKLGKATVADMAARLQAKGHLAIIPGQSGRGNSHRYRMLIKGEQSDLFDTNNNVRSAEHLLANENVRPAGHFDAAGKGRLAGHLEDDKRPVCESETSGLHEINVRPAGQNHLREPSREQNPSSDPPTRAAPPATKAADREISSAFDEWWKAYPHKVERKGAKAKYAAVVKRGEATVAELLAGAKAYAEAKTGSETRFIKHPTTWLNNGCWADERATVAKPNGATAPDDAFWRERVQKFRATGAWALPGPKPGQNGCRVPGHILAEFNIRPP